MPPIYLDCNSTCPLLPEVAAALAEANAALYANPASQHAEGRRARRALEDAREEIARLLGADLTGPQPDRLIFTSGGTEANNLALCGLTRASLPLPLGEGRGEGAEHSPFPIPHSPFALIVSSAEHPSVMATADALAHQGSNFEKLRVTHDGLVDLAHLDELLSALPLPLGEACGELSRAGRGERPSAFRPPPSALISVLLANNETGVLQPIPEIVRRFSAASQNGNAVLVHTDAVQAVGKIPVSFRALGVAAMTVAPHKFGGPRGIGALLVRHGVELSPILHGATQQFGLRPGTESVVLAIGFLAALRAWERDRDIRPRRLAALRDRFESGLRALKSQILINASAAPRLPNTSNVAFLGHDRQALFMALDLAGVCCSTGSACQSGSSEPSPTLLAMGLPPEIVSSSLRFSLGPTTTDADIDESLRRIAEVLSLSLRGPP